MPVTQRKRSMLLFRKLKFIIANANAESIDDEALLDIEKMMLHCLDCLAAIQCVQGRYDPARAKVFWGAVETITEIGIDSTYGHMERRHPGASQLLRAFPTDARPTDSRGWLPLHWAAVTDNVDVKDVRSIARADPLAIVKGVNLPISANPGHLIAAVRQPNMQVVKCLYDFHPRMASAKDNDGDLPLHYAARYTSSIEMIKFLLQANPSATKVPGDGMLVPLQCAIYNQPGKSRVEIVQCLLEADPTAATVVNSDGDTALHLAIDQECEVEIITLLLKAYADAAKIRNYSGLLPLHLGCYLKNHSKSFTIVEVLLQYYPEGATIEAASGHLAAHYAAEYSCAEVFDIVLRANPAAISTGNSAELNNTPLIKAVLGSNEETVRFICEHYPETCQIKNSQSRLPIHFAAEKECKTILEILYEAYPAGLQVIDSEGRLPLHIFTEDHQDMVIENGPEAECLRYMLRKYPSSAALADTAGNTPFDLCNRDNFYVRRLVLNIYPSIDYGEYRYLNYMARRMAMFLAFCAINADGIPTILCRIRCKDINLLKEVVAFL
eukprot:gene13198-17686_t